jgi:serine/threonine-protein kinase
VRCLEKEPERRFSSVAELAVALEMFAPHDTRELADRIGRIASGKRLSAAPARAPAQSALPEGTTATWTEKSGSLQGQRRSVLLAAAGVAAVAVVAALGIVAVTKQGGSARPTEQKSASREGAEVVTTDASAGALGTPASSGSAPSASASAAPQAPVVPMTAPAGASVPSRGSPPKEKPTPATSASTNEAPKYRTPW